MSKQAFLQKTLIKEGGIALAVVVATIALMEITAGFEADAQNSLRQTRSQLSSTTSQLGTMRNQISESGSAQERYVGIRLQRDQEDYEADNALMRERLVALKEKYRLTDDLSIKLSPEEVVKTREFSALNHEVAIRKEMLLSFGAMTDLHVFSFLDEFQRVMPGVVRLTKMSLVRKKDLDVSVLSQMTSGGNPPLVEAKIEFLWATLKAKEEGGNK